MLHHVLADSPICLTYAFILTCNCLLNESILLWLSIVKLSLISSLTLKRHFEINFSLFVFFNLHFLFSSSISLLDGKSQCKCIYFYQSRRPMCIRTYFVSLKSNLALQKCKCSYFISMHKVHLWCINTRKQYIKMRRDGCYKTAEDIL